MFSYTDCKTYQLKKQSNRNLVILTYLMHINKNKVQCIHNIRDIYPVVPACLTLFRMFIVFRQLILFFYPPHMFCIRRHFLRILIITTMYVCRWCHSSSCVCFRCPTTIRIDIWVHVGTRSEIVLQRSSQIIAIAVQRI